jgi:hypothetical protein
LLERLRSSESPIRDVYRHARKHPRVTLGAAAGTAAAVVAVTAGLSAATSPAHHTAGAPFPAAHAAPIATGSRPATPAIKPSAPAAADHSVAHSSAVAQPQHGATPARHPAAAHAAPAKQAAPARAARAAAGKQAAPAAKVPSQHNRKTVAGHQGPGRVRGHLTQHKKQARHVAWHRHRAAKKAWPYLIYDSVTPTAIPSNHVVATYATGAYAASAGDVAGRKAVLWIDTHGTDPQAAALDVEPGDATPSMAASWAWQRLHAHPREHAIIYTMRSEWAAAQASIGTLPHWMQNHVRWWIADPTGYPHVVPGSNATQWYWGTHYDITTAKPGF